jgi:hypothetical protein
MLKIYSILTLGLLILVNSLPGLAAEITPLRTEVKPFQGTPTLFLNGKPESFMLYALISPGPRQLRFIKSFRDAGIHFYEVPLNFGECFSVDGKANFSSVENGISEVLARDPDAFVLPRLYLAPPAGWYEKNPVEYSQFATDPPGPDGKILQGPVSLASTKWLQTTIENLHTYISYLEKSRFGPRILGYHLAYGTTGEWHYEGFSRLPDTGPAMTLRFRQWLKNKYGENSGYQTATVPDRQERCDSHDFLFRDPTTADRKVTDYYRCQQEVVRDDILALCKAAKADAPNKLIGIFYGYYFHMGGVTLQAEGGHLCLEDILNSPDIDFLAGPYSYDHESRRVGGDGCLRTLPESIKAHGKLFLTEADSPTFLGDSQGNDLPGRGLITEAASISVMRRDFCNTLIHGLDLWWFDVGPKDAQGGFGGGWWNTPKMMAEIKRMKEIANLSLQFDRASAAEVLIVGNPETYYNTVYVGSGKDPLTYSLLNDTVRAVFRSGAPFDVVLAADLPKINLAQYKAFIFLDTFYLTDGERKAIEEKVKTNHNTVLWVYAPGYVSDQQLSVAAMSRLTGITLQKLDTGLPARIDVLKNKNPLTHRAAATFGLSANIRPAFCVKDSIAIPLGTIAGTPKTGLAVKKFPAWTSIYTFAPPIDPDLLRSIFRAAGVHIYNESNDVLYANKHFLAVNTDLGGLRTIKLPHKSDVMGLFKNKLLAQNTLTFDVNLKPKSVELFLITPPEKK